MPLTALICSGAFASEKMTILTKKERGKYHKVPPSRCSEHMMARDFRDDIVMKVVGWFLSPSHSTGFLCNFFILLAISSGLLVDTFCTCMGMGGASWRVPQVFLQHWIEIREGGGAGRRINYTGTGAKSTERKVLHLPSASQILMVMIYFCGDSAIIITQIENEARPKPVASPDAEPGMAVIWCHSQCQSIMSVEHHFCIFLYRCVRRE